MQKEDRKRFVNLALRSAIIFVVVVAGAFGISRFFLADFSDRLLSTTLADATRDTEEMGRFLAERLSEGFITPNDRARVREIYDKYGFIYLVAADKNGGVVFSMGEKEALELGKKRESGIFPVILDGTEGRFHVYDIAVGMPGGRFLHAGIPQEGLTPELADVTDTAGDLLRILFALALGLIAVAVTYSIVMLRRVRTLSTEIERQRRLAYLGEIAGSLAHEIRNPLNTINMNIQLLDEQLPETDENSSAKLSRIRNEVGRLDGILTSFLRFARPPRLSITKVDLREFIEKLAEFFGPEVERAGIKLILNIAEDLPSVSGDPEMLRQLFLNLLLNARDATPVGGAITITAWKSARRAHISVADTGCGIQKDMLEKIFEPYITTKPHGTGVGLAIVRRIVMDHGGSIRVESEPGKGTTFTVSILRR
jgi:signal transduction histidine kinase